MEERERKEREKRRFGDAGLPVRAGTVGDIVERQVGDLVPTSVFEFGVCMRFYCVLFVTNSYKLRSIKNKFTCGSH